MAHPSSAPLLSIPPDRQERELRRARALELGERLVARAVWTALGIFASWQVLGAGFVLLSGHVAGQRIGEALMAGAFAVGYGGAFFHLIVFYLRGRARDDW